MPPQKKSFLLYYDQAQIWNGLSDEQAGKLIKFIHNKIIPSENDILINYAYNIIKKKIDSDYDKWIDVCQKNKENIKNRWSNDR